MASRIFLIVVVALILYLIYEMQDHEDLPPSIRQRYLRWELAEAEPEQETVSTETIDMMFLAGELG